MKSFLLKGKVPIIKWGNLPDNTFFRGEIPSGYSLGVSPSEGYIILDVDVKPNKSGFDNIPEKILKELSKTFNYKTKNNGQHYWLKTNTDLPNSTSGLNIDVRTSKGYVVWYSNEDIHESMNLVNTCSDEMNIWLRSIFIRNYGSNNDNNN
jgi:hypothetical protein